MNPAPPTSPKAAQAEPVGLQEANQDEAVGDPEQPEILIASAAQNVLEYDDEEAEEKKEVEN